MIYGIMFYSSNHTKIVLSPEEFFTETGDEKAKKALKLLSKRGHARYCLN
jgi:hypothetical protein